MLNPPDAGGGSAPVANGGSSNAGGDVANGGVADVGGGDPALPDAGQSAGGAAGEMASAAGLGGLPASGGNGGTGGTLATGGKAGNGGSGGVLHELAGGKTVTASSQETGNEATHGNDGSMSTRWCASGGTFPQWWKVDLGANHLLVQASISFEHADRTYVYVVETSLNDAVYTQQIMANGTGAIQTVALPPSVTARYVRVTVTSATPTSVNGNGTWASFWEFSLQGY